MKVTDSYIDANGWTIFFEGIKRIHKYQDNEIEIICDNGSSHLIDYSQKRYRKIKLAFASYRKHDKLYLLRKKRKELDKKNTTY